MRGALAHFEQLIAAAESDGERDEPVMLGDLATVMRLVVVAVQASYELGRAHAVEDVDALESEVNELSESLRNDLDEEARNRRNDVRDIENRIGNVEDAVGNLERAR